MQMLSTEVVVKCISVMVVYAWNITWMVVATTLLVIMVATTLVLMTIVVTTLQPLHTIT